MNRSQHPAAIARHLYGGTFGLLQPQQLEAAGDRWASVSPEDRSFIHTHLQYLGLMALHRIELQLQSILEASHDGAGATIAIAELLTEHDFAPMNPYDMNHPSPSGQELAMPMLEQGVHAAPLSHDEANPLGPTPPPLLQAPAPTREDSSLPSDLDEREADHVA